MGDIAGTIRKLMINGISFNVAADCDITEVGSKSVSYTHLTLPTTPYV